MNELKLEMRGISLEFPGVKALSDVDFDLTGGTIHALIGANGAGKSTLMKVLAGANAQYKGQVFVEGEPVEIRSPKNAKDLGIEIVYQEVDTALIPYLTVAENVMVGHTIMRSGLMKHQKYPKFAEDISYFLVNSLLLSTDVVMGHKDKKAYVKSFINPDLCEISEDLVYSEPFIDYNNRNNVFPPNAEFVKKELYDDEALRLEAAKLKFEFMNNSQALIHGDLHTGSIFINQEHTYIFDPEFAFYGPMGYDVGNVIANMFFAWCNADATIEDEAEKADYCEWVLDTIVEIVDKFIENFKVSFKENVTDTMAKTDGFMDWYLHTILADTAGIAGLESIRRMVGMANVKDITTISDTAKRSRAEKIIITLAKDYIMNRESFVSGKDYKNAIEKAVAKF